MIKSFAWLKSYNFLVKTNQNNLKDTNADLKISLYVRVHVKTIP